MSRSQIEARMSLCLDGRLSSEARSRLMIEIAESNELTQLWQQMKAAQELALGQPSARASRNFRDDVWQRIHSGEGAPEAGLTTPISTGKKIQYGLLGAAAAALFITTLHFSFREQPIQNTAPQDVAKGEAPDNGTTRPPQPVLQNGKLSARLVAERAANQVDQAVRELNGYSGTMRNPAKELRGNSKLQRDVRQTVRALEDGVFVLRDMQKNNLLEIKNSNTRDCLVRAETLLETLSEQRWPEDFQRIMNLSRCSLQNLHGDMGMPIQAERMFHMWIQQRVQQDMQEHHRRLVEALQRMRLIQLQRGGQVEIRPQAR